MNIISQRLLHIIKKVFFLLVQFSFQESCYYWSKDFKVELSWNDANKFCVEEHPEAHLVSIQVGLVSGSALF